MVYIKRFRHLLFYLGSLTVSLGNLASEDLNGTFCNPNCKEPVSRLTFNSDMTFIFSTKMFGGMSRSGSWERVKENKIKINTLKISSPNKAYQMPPSQTITILSNQELKIGNITYIK